MIQGRLPPSIVLSSVIINSSLFLTSFSVAIVQLCGFSKNTTDPVGSFLQNVSDLTIRLLWPLHGTIEHPGLCFVVNHLRRSLLRTSILYFRGTLPDECTQGSGYACCCRCSGEYFTVAVWRCSWGCFFFVACNIHPIFCPGRIKKSIPPFSALSFNTKQKELDGKSNTQECRKVKIVKPCKAGRRIDWFKFGGLMRLIRWLQNRRWIWTGIIS